MLFEFDFMLMQLALSESCPYSIEYLERVDMGTLLKIKDKVDYMDALKLAIKLDQNEDMKKK